MAARAELEQSQLEQRQVAELAALDTRSVWAELVAARATWEASAGTVQQAQRAYEIANVRYSAGVSTQLELSDARLQQQQAEANRARAARDLQVARAHVALLPDLPVGAATGAVPATVTPQPVPQTPQPAQDSGQFRNASTQGSQLQVGTR
jgi:outer membrane protein TolC